MFEGNVPIFIFEYNTLLMKKKNFNFIFTLILILVIGASKAQAQESDDVRRWRIEIEPISVLYKGFGGQVMYRVAKQHDFSVGLYAIALDVPKSLRKNMFENLDANTSARLGFEMAAVARYKVPLFDMESNPVVGAILGWEYFDFRDATKQDLRITTLIATPYLGYEFYLFKQMVYVNPQIRAVFYLGTETSDATRPEGLSSFFLLPTASIGVRL